MTDPQGLNLNSTVSFKYDTIVKRTEEEIKGLGEKHIVKVLGKGGFVRMGIRIKRIRTDFY